MTTDKSIIGMFKKERKRERETKKKEGRCNKRWREKKKKKRTFIHQEYKKRVMNSTINPQVLLPFTTITNIGNSLAATL